MTIEDCGRHCLTYTTDEGEYDVAAYDIDCPVHGWRFDWEGGPLDLADAQKIDEERLDRHGWS